MPVAQRHSLWYGMVDQLWEKIANLPGKEIRLSESDLLEYLIEAALDANEVLGIARSKVLRFGFNPIDPDDLTRFNEDVYENNTNMSVGYKLFATNTANDAIIESKSIILSDKQIGLLRFYWTQTGSTGTAPEIDISLNKDPHRGDEIIGTWLVEDNRLEAIVQDQPIDTSMMVSQTFSVRWKFFAAANYEIQDTTIKIILIDAGKMYQRQRDLVHIAAAEILGHQALVAQKDGQSTTFVEGLQQEAIKYLSKVKGIIGGNRATGTGAGATEHDYDRDALAEKGFRKVHRDDLFVEVRGNSIIGKSIRRVW